MIELHGWIRIEEAPYFVESGNSHWGVMMDGLRREVKEVGWGRDSFSFAEVRVMNGEARVTLGCRLNHTGNTWDKLGKLLDWIRKSAPGSYGLIYWQDDEHDNPAGAGNFHVKVIARGRVETRLDPFLSPTIPVVEDAYDG